MSYAPSILIVDDEPQVRAFFEQVLLEVGYYVTAVPTARRGLWALSQTEFEIVILDFSLPDGDGLELVRQIRGEYPHLRILATSGFMVGDMPSIALEAGATDTLVKPTTSRALLNAIYRLLDPSGAWIGRSNTQTENLA